MLNQVVLIGEVVEIYQTSFIVKSSSNQCNIKINCEFEEIIAQLLLNNLVGVKGRLESSGVNGEELSIVLEKLTILDGRGKKND